jgi:cytidylate kinase
VSNRAAASLLQAEDAHRLDTSELGVEGAIAEAVAAVDARVGART